MELERIDIKYFSQNSLHSDHVEGLQHVKVLPWLSIVQAVEGSYDITLGGGPVHHTGEGGFFVAPSGVRQTIVHHHSPMSGRMHGRWIFLDTVVGDTKRFDARLTLPLLLPEPARVQMNALFNTLFSTDDTYERYAVIYRILGLLSSQSRPKSPTEGHVLPTVLDYIEQHLHEEIRISDLAACACMSPSNLYIIFKKHLGVSPLVYVNNARLSLGAEYLRLTDDSISSVAARVGISDAFYFSRLFRRTYAMSPRQYREEYRST